MRALCLWLLLLPALADAAIVVKGLMRDMAVVEIDGTLRTLRVGEVSPEGVRLIEAFSDYAVLERDGQRRIYRLGETTAVEVVPKAQAITRIPPRRGMYYVDGAIDGKPLTFIVDTGATWVSLSARQAEAMGIDYRSGTRARSATASGIVPIYRIRLRRVRAGNIELRNVEAAVLPGDSPPMALLGMSFLNRVHMERRGQVMVLKER